MLRRSVTKLVRRFAVSVESQDMAGTRCSDWPNWLVDRLNTQPTEIYDAGSPLMKCWTLGLLVGPTTLIPKDYWRCRVVAFDWLTSEAM